MLLIIFISLIGTIDFQRPDLELKKSNVINNIDNIPLNPPADFFQSSFQYIILQSSSLFIINRHNNIINVINNNKKKVNIFLMLEN